MDGDARASGVPGGPSRSPDTDRLPLVTVVLATRDRPRLLSVALRCYAQQTYAERELVVVDNGDVSPVEETAVAAVGGRLLRVVAGTPLGTKLNLGVEAGRGALCQKMDDDDWYAPEFLQTMVTAAFPSVRADRRPVLAFQGPYLSFDVARWELRRSPDHSVAGGAMLFGRDEWRACPFRPLARSVDTWLRRDYAHRGVELLPVRGLGLFVQVRHGGAGGQRGHTWLRERNGMSVEESLLGRALHLGRPEDVLPRWAVEVYAALRRDLPSAVPR